MKLLLCTQCQDVFKLTSGWRSCICGRTRGRYTDEINAEYCGEYAVPIGFANHSLATAVKERPEVGDGKLFVAFVIPRRCSTMQIAT